MLSIVTLMNYMDVWVPWSFKCVPFLFVVVLIQTEFSGFVICRIFLNVLLF